MSGIYFEKRTRLIKLFLFIFLFLIILRLWYWQIIRHSDLAALADEQRTSSREVLAPRGDILFADGSKLASTQPTFLLFAQPKIIKDKIANAKLLSGILATDLFEEQWNEKAKTIATIAELEELNIVKKEQIQAVEDSILAKISKDLYWVNLGFSVDADTKIKIEKLNLVGFGFDQKTTRFYPEGSSSAHLLGFIGSDSYGFDTGYFGIEGYYNGELKGQSGLIVQEKDAHGIPILIGDYRSKAPQEGKTLILHIDRTIQTIVEEKLKKGIEKYKARGASAIVMDPYSGNILAMASYPNYHPEDPKEYPKQFFRNPVTVDGYEPGSTFKVMVMAGAINENLVEPDTRCDICFGPVSIGGFSINTWNNQYHPNSTMTDVIVNSDNTGMVFVSKKLGQEKMYEYITKFGFGSLTGIDVQDEETPLLREKDSWREIDLATSSFGQGIQVSAIQIIRAVAAIANGGKLMEPHIVDRIVQGEEVIKISPRELGRPISPETATIMKEMMIKAAEQGESKYLKARGYRIAGKTGTAQIPVSGHYDPNKTIASFVGFAPADNPKFIILIRFDEPTTSKYGAETAAPVFYEISHELFNYFGIPPSL